MSTDTDSRFVGIALKSTQPNSLKIGAIGPYKLKEKILNLTTQGYLIVVSSRDKDTPTRVFYFGDYNPFRFGDEEETVVQRMNGYFFDDLDYETKDFDKTEYAGPAGNFMAYIRCGE